MAVERWGFAVPDAVASSAATTPAPLDGKAQKKIDRQIRANERSDRQMAKSYSRAEIELLKQYGATPDIVKQEKRTNQSDWEAARKAQKASGYQEFGTGLLPTAAAYKGTDFESRINDVMGRTQGIYDQFGLDPVLKTKVKGGVAGQGFDPHRIAYQVANQREDGTYLQDGKYKNAGLLLNFANAAYNKPLSSDELSQYGKVKELKKTPGSYKMVLTDGKGTKQKAFFSQDENGNFVNNRLTRESFKADKADNGILKAIATYALSFIPVVGPFLSAAVAAQQALKADNPLGAILAIAGVPGGPLSGLGSKLGAGMNLGTTQAFGQTINLGNVAGNAIVGAGKGASGGIASDRVGQGLLGGLVSGATNSAVGQAYGINPNSSFGDKALAGSTSALLNHVTGSAIAKGMAPDQQVQQMNNVVQQQAATTKRRPVASSLVKPQIERWGF